MDKKVRYLLRIIRFSPPLGIIIASFFIITLLYHEQNEEFKKEKLFLETEYIEIEKNTIYSNVNTIDNYIKNEIQNSEKSLKDDLKIKINTVHKIATNLYLKNKDTLSKNEIINQIKNSIEILRFNEGRSYFSIHNMEGVNILHPINPKFEGTSILNRQDAKGNYSVHQAIEIAKTKGEGFLSWYYFKPNDKSKEFKKIGIVKKFEPYNLIITTAEYVDEYERNLRKKVLNDISKIQYKNEGFIFIINGEGEIILHESKEILNYNIYKDNKFKDTREFFNRILSKKNAKSEGFLRIKPKITLGEDTKDEKIIYAKKFDDWNWIIATSFNLSDTKKITEKRKIILEEKYDNYKKNVFIYGFIFTIILLILSYYMSKLIEKKILKYKNNLEEQILENSNQKERLIKAQQIANMGDWQLDLKTNKSFWSDECINIFGFDTKDKDKFSPEYLKGVIFKEDIPSFEDSIKRCIETGSEHNSIYRIKKDNEVRWINCRGEIDSKRFLILGTVQDITDTKKLELEKKQKEELLYQENKMAAMGEMIANIAHQWRQPLSTISTASTGAKLQKEMDCLSDDQLYSALTSINNSSQYLSQTIDDFREFFNPNNNKIKEFNISDTLSKTFKLISSQYKVKNIKVIKNIEDYKLLSIENELIQVLINILNNARDIVLIKEKERKLIFINAYQKDDISYIEIIDNGDGIKEEIINRIFEPYFTTKHKSQGTGIGLYMSEEIIKNHLNGYLTVENVSYNFEGIEYRGAKFTIKINVN
ncbi:cache domain-containing protein [Poseidonibacter lekithochrous]|uniref:cache domain-containing protein n=1 Tax=Poseidonibacter TaxID=2321187 RepID=UPI001C0A015D|nr:MULTISPECIES: cache domain-containing protein [Poseidonibacter]MBU3015883.1 cache domain-containing protein [Poseidonibacter lekithochrous]MDO6829182.1 cache domain-containing protein [Poseidonibacter sp. 1_MG-2023]